MAGRAERAAARAANRANQQGFGNDNSGSESGSESDNQVDNGNDRNSKIPWGLFKAKLRGKNDFDAWSTSLRDFCFGANTVVYDMYKQGMSDNAANDPDPAGAGYLT